MVHSSLGSSIWQKYRHGIISTSASVVVVTLLALFFFGYVPNDFLFDESATLRDNSMLKSTPFRLGYIRSEGAPTGSGYISFLYKDDIGILLGAMMVSVAIDSDGNGIYAPEEWRVKNMLARPRPSAVQTYYFPAPERFRGRKDVRVVFTKDAVGDFAALSAQAPGKALSAAGNELIEHFEYTASVRLYDIRNVLGRSSGEQGADLLKGIPRAYAHGWPPHAPFSVFWDLRRDLAQQEAECAPMAAADILLTFAEDFEWDDKLPGQATLIEDLKRAMHWSRERGVHIDDVAAGINAVADAYGLFARAARVGDESGRLAVHWLTEVIDKGGLGLLQVRLIAPRTNVAKSAHAVALHAVHKRDERFFLEIADPASPFGTDVYELSADKTILKNYGMFDGEAHLGWAYAFGFEDQETGRAIYELTSPQEMRQLARDWQNPDGTIEVGELQGTQVISFFLEETTDEACTRNGEPLPHYHAEDGFAAVALDGTVFYDTEPCGFGLLEHIPLFTIPNPFPASAQ